jgi:hypothetical protein
VEKDFLRDLGGIRMRIEEQGGYAQRLRTGGGIRHDSRINGPFYPALLEIGKLIYSLRQFHLLPEAVVSRKPVNRWHPAV